MISLLNYLCHLIFLLFLTIHHVTSFSFYYNFSDPAFDRSTVRLEGDAFFDGDVINLSRYNAAGNFDQSQGRVTYMKPILLWDPFTGTVANFTTSFTFAIRYTDDEQPGDGMTFFLLPYPSDLTDSSSQGCLGAVENCYSSSSETETHVIAVEFDSYMNDWDPSSNHFGIDVNTISSVTYQNITLISNYTDMRITSNISYNSGTKLLTVLVYSDNDEAFGNYSLSANVDLMKILPAEVAIGFSGATGHAKYVELHQIFSWYFDSTFEPRNISSGRSLSNNLKLLIGLVTCLIIVAGFGSIVLWRKYRINSSKEVEMHKLMHEELPRQIGPKVFEYDELLAATKNFAEENKLSRGGFGWVYIGFLSDLNIHVAIKRLGKTLEQGMREFKSEVGIISNLRHRNLVELVGWCHHRNELLLVYEYMPNGSLDTHLYPRNNGAATLILQWPTRYRIVLGLGSVLSYLHRDWNQCVVHRDIKPSNIMLDSSFNAKLGDFGLARLIDHKMGTQTTNPAGTIGYLAPECFYTGHTSKESDVYSLGVVLLEIACGRTPNGRRPGGVPEIDYPEKRLIEWVWELYGQSRILEAADDRLNRDFEAGQMERVMVVGLWCAHPDDSQRPDIKKAMDVLCSEAPLPSLPPQMPIPLYAAPTEHLSISSHSARTPSAGSTIARWATSFFRPFAGSMSAWLSDQQQLK